MSKCFDSLSTLFRAWNLLHIFFLVHTKYEPYKGTQLAAQVGREVFFPKNSKPFYSQNA